MSEISRSVWEQALKKVTEGEVAKDDPLVLTSLEFSREFNLTHDEAYKRLRKMVRSGLATPTKKLGERGIVPAYRLHPDKL